MMGIMPRKCPECGSKNLAYNNDGLICSKCGLIIFERYE